ncbi:MAG: BamA/TamA family outer membrane protein [Mucilaginibacter sp.]
MLVFGVGLAVPANAQHKKYIPLLSEPTLHKANEDTTAQDDLGDVIHAVFHTKASSRNDSIGKKPVISVVPALGYALQSRLAILLSGNIAFRTGPQSRISTIIGSAAYTQNKQFTIPIQSSIWNKDNTYNLVGEIRYYEYPQSTFGLGSSSSIENEDPMDYDYVRFAETVLRHIAGNFYAGAGYIIDTRWGISHQGTENGSVSDFVTYGADRNTTSSGLTLNGLFDNRDFSINPSSGFYASYQLRQNLKALGSNSSWSSLVLDVRKYLRFPDGSKNVIALWSYDWLTLSGKPPYLDLPSTLWDASTNAGRGYIQGRFRGAQMVYAEAEYRYMITRNGLLGGVVFINAESFSAAPGTRLQAIQPGFGPGLRIKLNKVSKTNICVDYGFGREGSRGLFVNVGEIF